MQHPFLEPQNPVGAKALVRRGSRGLCPNCGEAKIFQNALKIHHRCPHCGMTLERGDGFYLGPLCLNYGFVAFSVVSPLLLAGFAGWISLEAALTFAFLAAFCLPLLLYRWSWSLWLTIYYLCLPGELHANREADCDDLSFEEEQRTAPKANRPKP